MSTWGADDEKEEREIGGEAGQTVKKHTQAGGGGKADSNKKAYRGGYRTGAGTGKEREREEVHATRLVYKAEVGGYRQYSTLLRTLLGL